MEAKKAKVNREFKDGMFRTLFNDKEKMLELYNAVSDEQMGKEAIDDIETLTIETPLYIGSRNDLAFLIDGKSMFFCEQQSTRSGNMALRLSSYFGKTLDMMFGSEIYGTRKLMMAPPSFFVLIFGDKDTPELQVEPLSKHYTEKPPKNSMELVVNVYNICYSEDNKILKRSKTLREYSKFISFVNEYLDREMSLEEAVAASVKRAKEEGILVDFLNKYATEVEGMLTGITVEEYGMVMKKEGFEDGKEAEKHEIAKALKDKGVDIEIIAETSGLSVEEIEKL
ncbi:MAG: hypothetical protein PUG78_10675 [Eubacteriales bacterium]|nr:hypothetical protein [Eubacteriales bacterium]